MEPSSPSRRFEGTAALMLASVLAMVVVSAIYWPQAMIEQIRGDLGEPGIVALMPGATLLGYALGVTALAIASTNLDGRGGLACHTLVYVGGLLMLAAAPTAAVAACACVLVGAGCALTQRLLIIATSSIGPERRSDVIGLIVASGLVGIVGARAWVAGVASDVGWRSIIVVNAVIASMIVVVFWILASRTQAANVARPLSAVKLWLRYPTLRRASIQQAVVFAAFNAGWAVLPTLTSTTPSTRAVVAGIGAATALIAGRTARGLRPELLAAIAPIFVVLAAALALLAATRPAFLGGMVLLEIGTQLALVANQTRAQAVAPDVGSRGRMASLVTAVGFIGGAFGAAAANMLVR